MARTGTFPTSPSRNKPRPLRVIASSASNEAIPEAFRDQELDGFIAGAPRNDRAECLPVCGAAAKTRSAPRSARHLRALVCCTRLVAACASAGVAREGPRQPFGAAD